MQKNADLYYLTQTLQGTLYQAGQKHYLESLTDEERDNQPQRPGLFSIQAGYAESIGWMMVQLAEFDPEPLTVEKFRRRAVYSAPRLSQAMLELIASEKWANRDGEAYTFTEIGRALVQTLAHQRSTLFADYEPIPARDLNKLTTMSERIIQASLNRGDADATWSLRYSNRRKPTNSDSSVNKLIHVCTDFNAFRDDAHMSAYGKQGVDGMTWEAFSWVDDGSAVTAQDLFEGLAYRGWTISEWQTAVHRLVDKGWLMGDEAGYQSTATGKAVRAEVEQHTDTLFYAPWDTLSDQEQVEYVHLLNLLNDTCLALISN